MLTFLLACAPGSTQVGTYGNASQLALVAADFLLQARNGVDAQTFATYNTAPADNSLGLWDGSYTASSVNPNVYRIVVSVGSDGLIDVVRPYGTSGSVTIPSGGYVVQASGTYLPYLSGLVVDDELLIRSASVCGPRTLGVPVITTHNIGSDAAVLETRLQDIAAAGYTTITLEDLRYFLNGTGDCDPILPDKAVLLTFDDGYADQFPTVPELLDSYGMVGTFFIITSYPGTTSTWASWTAISDAVTAYPDAVELGCHSHAGHYQTTIGGKLVSAYLQSGFDVAADLATCRSTLLTHTGVDTAALAWPFGSHNDDLIEVASDAGFDLMFSTFPGINTPDNDDPMGEARRFGGNLPLTWASIEGTMDHWAVCGSSP